MCKFHKDRYKIVWGVALTRYPLSLHCHRIWGQKMTKFTKWKKWQKLIQGLYSNHMHISRPWGKHVQSFKKIGIKLYEELRSHSTHCHNTFMNLRSENDKVRKEEKVTKINARITSKPYAQLGWPPSSRNKIPCLFTDFSLTKLSFSLTKILRFYNLFVFSQPINDKFPLLVH